jgi:hypothetical protein
MLNNSFDPLNLDGIYHLPNITAESQLASLQNQEARLYAQIQELQGKLKLVQLDIKQLKELHPGLEKPINIYNLPLPKNKEFPWQI